LAAMTWVLLGIGIGWLSFGRARSVSSPTRGSSNDVEAPHPATTAQVLHVVNRTEIDPQLLREQVARAVEEALDARATASPKAVASSGEPAPEQPIAERSIAAFDAARAVLAKATAARRWTHASRTELHVALAGATPEQRREIQQELVKRLNSGELEYDPGGE